MTAQHVHDKIWMLENEHDLEAVARIISGYPNVIKNGHELKFPCFVFMNVFRGTAEIQNFFTDTTARECLRRLKP